LRPGPPAPKLTLPMKSKLSPATLVAYGVIAHVVLLWISYLVVRLHPAPAVALIWAVAGALWIVWPVVILFGYRLIGNLIALMVAGIGWSQLALPICMYLAWAFHGFPPR
jgi:hypothetical protein